jgi:hypothetical protein
MLNGVSWPGHTVFLLPSMVLCFRPIRVFLCLTLLMLEHVGCAPV